MHALNMVSGVAGITHKTNGGFKDMMSRVAAANPYSPLAKEYGDKGVIATKKRDLVDKHRKIQSKLP